jgi:hypothetical protein
MNINELAASLPAVKSDSFGKTRYRAIGEAEIRQAGQSNAKHVYIAGYDPLSETIGVRDYRDIDMKDMSITADFIWKRDIVSVKDYKKC